MTFLIPCNCTFAATTFDCLVSALGIALLTFALASMFTFLMAYRDSHDITMLTLAISCFWFAVGFALTGIVEAEAHDMAAHIQSVDLQYTAFIVAMIFLVLTAYIFKRTTEGRGVWPRFLKGDL